MKLPIGARIAVATALTLTALAVLHHKPWRHDDRPPPPPHGVLTVGFLPVTCHLTCPVTDFATRHTRTGTRFESDRYADFPTVVEAIKARRLNASFMLAPLAMVLRAQGVPIKIVYLGHRDGSTVIVPKRSTARSLRDLRGKTLAIPNRYSNQYLVLTKLMEDQGLTPDEIKFVDLPPPDMPAALAAGAIDAFFVGEPNPARTELAGTGRVLYHAKDIWPGFISCVLVVRDELIAEHPEVVADLVRGIAESGEWAEEHRLDAARLVAPYYRVERKLLEYVLTQPPDRVSYRRLTPTDDDMKQIMHYAIKAGILDHEIPLDELLDRRFIPAEIKPAPI